jgi:hypothetical protein
MWVHRRTPSVGEHLILAGRLVQVEGVSELKALGPLGPPPGRVAPLFGVTGVPRSGTTNGAGGASLAGRLPRRMEAAGRCQSTLARWKLRSCGTSLCRSISEAGYAQSAVGVDDGSRGKGEVTREEGSGGAADVLGTTPALLLGRGRRRSDGRTFLHTAGHVGFHDPRTYLVHPDAVGRQARRPELCGHRQPRTSRRSTHRD